MNTRDTQMTLYEELWFRLKYFFLLSIKLPKLYYIYV